MLRGVYMKFSLLYMFLQILKTCSLKQDARFSDVKPCTIADVSAGFMVFVFVGEYIIKEMVKCLHIYVRFLNGPIGILYKISQV